ncbi:MAG: hypothetical protein R3D70_20635 [Rhizobiaceae bacterium]
MCELANLFEIPLIAIPWEVNFGDITRVLLTHFVESQYRFMELPQALNQELLCIVLRKASCKRFATAFPALSVSPPQSATNRSIR